MSSQDEFLTQARRLVFYGLSSSGKGFAYDLVQALRKNRPELAILPVHPRAAQLAGLQAQPSAAGHHPAPDSALIVLKAPQARPALEDAAAAGVKKVWLFLPAASRENIALAHQHGMQVVQGCPLLFLEGQGFPHNFHRALARLCGKL